jgi:TIR domain
MLLAMRPRSDTVYPFCRAQSRTACTWSRPDTAGLTTHRRDGFRHDVFISSTRETQQQADELSRLLSDAGLRVTDATSLQAGTPWTDETNERLDGSQHVVLLLGDSPANGSNGRPRMSSASRSTMPRIAGVLPILTSEQSARNMPSVFRSVQNYDLQSGLLAGAARLISGISGESQSDL